MTIIKNLRTRYPRKHFSAPANSRVAMSNGAQTDCTLIFRVTVHHGHNPKEVVASALAVSPLSYLYAMRA